MSDLIEWLETHDKLSGWAQFVGAMFALLLTYFTAFIPLWRRQKQLQGSANRLLSNGYEAIESYHRTSANFLPFTASLRLAASTMSSVADEIDRFPIYELDDQGSRSVARHLVTTSMTLKGLVIFLEPFALNFESHQATNDDQEAIRTFVGERLNFIRSMMSGEELKRPEWVPTS